MYLLIPFSQCVVTGRTVRLIKALLVEHVGVANSSPALGTIFSSFVYYNGSEVNGECRDRLETDCMLSSQQTHDIYNVICRYINVHVTLPGTLKEEGKDLGW